MAIYAKIPPAIIQLKCQFIIKETVLDQDYVQINPPFLCSTRILNP
jgi:hypothetical protein